MKSFSLSLLVTYLSSNAFVRAYVPQVKPPATLPTVKLPSKNGWEPLKKAAMASFTAATIASNVLIAPPIAEASNVVVSDYFSPMGSSSMVVSAKEKREGLYGEYEVDVTPQAVDDARSTFKEAKETKSKKGKYTALIAILVVGSFIIPMAQYFWYVKDDDSSDRFFEAQKIPDPEPEPKKKGWFGK